MNATPSMLAALLAECDARDIDLTPTADGGLKVDAPGSALPPDLRARLKKHKADLLAFLRYVGVPPDPEPGDAAAVWKPSLDMLEGNPRFPPELLQALRSASMRWSHGVPPPGLAHAPPLDPLPVATARVPAEPI